MKVYLVVLALVGLSAAAPQNWPYRDSLMPYRYGYPTQSQYKYLPQIEDDEEVGPYLGRQDFVVGSDGDRVRPTPESVVSSGVIETGSVAPVVEPTIAPQPVQTTRLPPPPPPKPVGPDGGGVRPVQPPVFPPARPPPTPAPKEDDEDEEDDESDEEEADDEGAENGPEGNDEGPEEGDDDNEEEEEEERRRQEPLNSDETVEVAQVPAPADKVKPAVIPAPQPVVVPAPVAKPAVVVTESSVEEVNATTPVESNEVGNQSEDESSEELGLGGGVEALVPGYVTDQGEVLVPVDTVTGDQPISIVPDPYTPPSRGVSLRRAPYDDQGYSNYYYPEDNYYEGLGRQDESDEDSGPSPDDEDESDDDDGPEARNEYLNAFPPARTPELYALIGKNQYQNPQYSGEDLPYQRQGQGHQGPYAHNPYQQRQPIIYQVRQKQNNPSVSLAVRVSGFGGQNNGNPYVGPVGRYPVQPQYVDDQYNGGGGAEPVLRGPYNPYRPQYRPQQYRPQYRPPYSYNQRPANYNPSFGGYGVRPIPIFAGGQGPQPFGPRPVYGGQRPRPNIRPGYAYGNPIQPVFIQRRPIAASVRPVPYNRIKAPLYFGQYAPISPKFSQKKRPTQVVLQDDEPYSYETPFSPFGPEPSSDRSQVVPRPAAPATQKKVEPGTAGSPSAPKTRRAAKMSKKLSKKTMEKKKKMTDPDPLNILKKITLKRS